ncbi:MAG TPA: IPExxxVDY family protein [Cytophagaceae bacterium]
MKTTKLVVDYDFDFQVLAVISAAKGYKMAWNLNKAFKINLCKEEDICLNFVNDSQLVINSYVYETEYSCFRLLKNKSCEFTNIAKPFLLPELKEYDYIILLSGETEMFDSDMVVEKIKQIPVVEYVKKVDLQSLKSKENLIF